MKQPMHTIAALALSLFTGCALATPRQLITHNLTDVESNAFVAGTIPSQHPTHPHSDGKVFWTAVKMACFGHITDGKCSALIKMATNTSNMIELGYVSIDMATGEITPKYIHANGYSVTVNGPAECTLNQD